MPGDLGDLRFNSVILEHVYQWLTGQTRDLWSPRFSYPFNKILAFSDSHLGSFWIYAAARFLGATREMSFQAWFVAGFLLNFGSAYRMLRRMKFNVLWASCAAFAFNLPDQRRVREVAFIGLSFVTCGLVIWMLVQYQTVSAEYRLSRPIEALEPLIPRFSSYLLADQSGLTSWIGKSVRSFPTRPEHQMFSGVWALLFLLAGLFALVSKRYLSVESHRWVS